MAHTRRYISLLAKTVQRIQINGVKFHSLMRVVSVVPQNLVIPVTLHTMSDVIIENCKPASSFSSVFLHEPVKIRSHNGGSKPITVPQLFEMIVKKYGQHPALVFQDGNNNWMTYTYQEYWTKSRLIARAFIKLGLKPRTSCGILAIGSPVWFFTQMATIFVGGVSAGIYLTNSAEAVFHILYSSGATICVVDDWTQMEKVRSVRHRLPELKSIIQIEGPYADFVDSEEGYYSWSKVEELGSSDAALELQVIERLKEIVANECVTLIYTSGTVGMPKGVMLSHDNVINASRILVKGMTNVNYGHEVLVSYLPMSHVGGQVLDFFMGIFLGACVYFADRNALKGTLIKTLTKAQPTRFFGLPRIYDKMQEKLMAINREMPWMLRFIVSTARSIVQNYHLAIIAGGNKPIYSSSYWLASEITRNFRPAIGLSQCKTFLTGAAPFALELKKFFLGYDIKLSELYGLSETSGAFVAAWDMQNLESCGKAMSGVEVNLANTDENGHGEICTRGRMVFMGYLHDAEKTKEVLSDDGWLHTGDIGFLDSKEQLYISGRLKELLVTSGGENIPPVQIECLVRNELPGLSNAILIGDRRKFLTMLVTIKTDIDHNTGKLCDSLQPESLEWIKSLGLQYVTLSEILNAGPCPKVLQSIQEGIDRANLKAISNAQRVQKFAILPHDFSILTGELGPTLKLRRNIVVEKYTDIIENLYRGT